MLWLVAFLYVNAIRLTPRGRPHITLPPHRSHHYENELSIFPPVLCFDTPLMGGWGGPASGGGGLWFVLCVSTIGLANGLKGSEEGGGGRAFECISVTWHCRIG